MTHDGSLASKDARTAALRRLPRVYSLAIRLQAAGLSEDLISECLSVEQEALGPLLELAEAKIQSILRTEGAATPPRDNPV